MELELSPARPRASAFLDTARTRLNPCTPTDLCLGIADGLARRAPVIGPIRPVFPGSKLAPFSDRGLFGGILGAAVRAAGMRMVLEAGLVASVAPTMRGGHASLVGKRVGYCDNAQAQNQSSSQISSHLKSPEVNLHWRQRASKTYHP
jgi:hypothetical protein